MTAKKKRGAPKKTNPKMVTISLRLEQDHRDQFEAAARARGGLSLSAFLRMAGIDFIKKNP